MKTKASAENSKESLDLQPHLTPPIHVAEVKPGTDFTGVARSVQCFLNKQDSQDFNNYRIVTLHIEKGKVTKAEYSDMYASFEALTKLESANHAAIVNLGNHYQEGRTLSK